MKTSPPMDVLWFRLPKAGGDMEAAPGLWAVRAGGILWCSTASTTGRSATYFPRAVPAGQAGRDRGDAARHPGGRAGVAERVETLTDWQQLTLLSVESSRLPAVAQAGAAADRRRGARDVAGRRRRHQLRHSGRGRRGQPAGRAAAEGRLAERIWPRCSASASFPPASSRDSKR